MSDDMLPKDVAPLQPLHTLQTDIAEALSSEHVSKVGIIAEQEKVKAKEKEREEDNSPDPTVIPTSYLLRNALITLVSIVVVVASGYGIFTIAQKRSTQFPVPIENAPEVKEIISYNTKKDISFSSEELFDREKLSAKLLGEAIPEPVDGVTFFKINTPIKDVLSILSPSLPSAYQRTLLDKSFYGGNTQGNFFIITYDSYEQAYAGQLEWENEIGNSLNPLFGILSSSTSTSRFEDRVVSNKDIRVAVDEKSKTLFVYGFSVENMIIFARNEDVFRMVNEMLLRRNL
jgi:hypothetical protein